jgi:hypothetical protein
LQKIVLLLQNLKLNLHFLSLFQGVEEEECEEIVVPAGDDDDDDAECCQSECTVVNGQEYCRETCTLENCDKEVDTSPSCCIESNCREAREATICDLDCSACSIEDGNVGGEDGSGEDYASSGAFGSNAEIASGKKGREIQSGVRMGSDSINGAESSYYYDNNGRRRVVERGYDYEFGEFALGTTGKRGGNPLDLRAGTDGSSESNENNLYRLILPWCWL